MGAVPSPPCPPPPLRRGREPMNQVVRPGAPGAVEPRGRAIVAHLIDPGVTGFWLTVPPVTVAWPRMPQARHSGPGRCRPRSGKGRSRSGCWSCCPWRWWRFRARTGSAARSHPWERCKACTHPGCPRSAAARSGWRECSGSAGRRRDGIGLITTGAMNWRVQALGDNRCRQLDTPNSHHAWYDLDTR